MMYKVIVDSKKCDPIEVDIPYDFHEEVWYCYKKRNRYVVRRSRISGIWATNMGGNIR